MYLLIEHPEGNQNQIELSIHSCDTDAGDCPIRTTSIEAVAMIAEEVLKSLQPEVFEASLSLESSCIMVDLTDEPESRLVFRIEPRVSELAMAQSIPQIVAVHTLVRIQKQMNAWMGKAVSKIGTPDTYH